MPTFELRRDTPLTTAEVASLPGGAVPVRGEGDTVARARFRALDPEAAVRMAYALGQAAPRASLTVTGLREVDPSPTDAAEPAETLWAQPAEETQEEPLAPPSDDESGLEELELDPPARKPTDDDPPPEDPGGEAPEVWASLSDGDADAAEPESPESPAFGGEPPAIDAPPAPVPSAADPGDPRAASTMVPPVAPVAEVDEAEDEETAPLLSSEPPTHEDPVPAPDPGPPPEPAALGQGPPPPPDTALVPASGSPRGDDTLVPEDPWAAWDSGDTTGALRAFGGAGLDSTGRARVRTLLQSTDPVEVAHGCEIARATDWRSSVQAMRRLLQHGDTRVRQAAVVAIGDLAGPALVPSVRMLLRDASPAVRGAAVAALMKLESD